VRLRLLAIGRLKQGPERDLVERYRERADALGRRLGFPELDLIEFAEDRGRSVAERKRAEAELLAGKAGTATTVAFDERGASVSSEDFAERLRGWRDAGRPAVAFAVGGPDGLDDGFVKRAELTLAFGRLTLPHQLVRVLVVEQVYRALTILAGHPYHRGESDEG
jgi:23S rRNA (pseudouridine1915-N3)-methyltransferase